MADTKVPSPALRKTPLFDVHKRLGGKLIDFGGWSLPVNYGGGILNEHNATRTAVGVFDVSHMGEFHFRGTGAAAAVQRLVTNDVSRLADGQALYTVACNERGGIVDDLIVYRVAADHFLTVVNAANIDKDLVWFRGNTGAACVLDDASSETALIAFQGPLALAQLEALGAVGVSAMKPFHFRTDMQLAGRSVWIARTGYTGEDGVEVFCATGDAVAVFEALVAAAEKVGGSPVGLGARDTLRLEAKLPLYGNDLSDETSPFEAGLGWVVKLDKPFIGAEPLRAQKAAGIARKLVGFVMKDRGIARHGYAVHASAGGSEPGEKVGDVTSGGVAPTVGKNVGMAYVPVTHASAGTPLHIDCRGKMVAAEVVDGPFYRRPKS